MFCLFIYSLQAQYVIQLWMSVIKGIGIPKEV